MIRPVPPSFNVSPKPANRQLPPVAVRLAVVAAKPVIVQAPSTAPAPVKGPVARFSDAWKKAWAPSWAGVPNWVHHLWESSGRAAVKFHNRASQSTAGRVAINALGTAMAGVWAVTDKVAGLRKNPAPPSLSPTGAVAPALPRFPGSLSWLSTQGNQIIDAAGQPVRLRGTNVSGLEYNVNADPLPTARLDQIVAMGANLVRVPLNQTAVLTDPAYVKRIDALIQAANARGVYIMIDMHWIKDHQTALPDAESLRMWRNLAARYAEQPGVLYDLHNEPGMIGWETNARWAEAAIAAMRPVHPRSLVFVEGTNKAQRVAGALERPIQAPNVVYQVHAYGPRQHGPGVGPAQWDRLFGKTAERLPVFVGEFGGEPDELPLIGELLSYLEKRGIGWAGWHSRDGEVFAADQRLAPLGQVMARSIPKS